ncbi:MAG: hypothetical protein KDB02_10635 [Acidimicrobiales bacterium]|nr:hypothetical protein [Acidimicrobiales bacterium]
MIGLVLAASDWTYVGWSYVVVIGTLVTFAVWTVLRGRRIGRRLPPEERRWM